MLECADGGKLVIDACPGSVPGRFVPAKKHDEEVNTTVALFAFFRGILTQCVH